MKKTTSSIAILLILAQAAFAQLTIRINTVPANTPADASIYVAGNFQGWNPGDPLFQLTEIEDGVFEIEITPQSGQLEFKFTRGDWSSVEGNASGASLPNRIYNYSGGSDILELAILSWEDMGNSGSNSTAQPNVQILDEDFFMPQLNRNRRIWIYLPPDYDTSQKDYPVLYMHDGQNVFDANTSFSGEWEVDESLNQLFNDGDYGVIVVAIDNGQSLRIDEYSPWVNPSYGGGEGDEYMAFIVDDLKPHIDSNYRTLSGREFTGLMGSSMGGLISLYGGIQHQDVFGKLGIFSPSYWFSGECFNHVSTTGKQQDMKIYTIIGNLEGASGVSNVNEMTGTLSAAGFTAEELNQMVHSDGQHSEWYWAREFPAAYEWLFGDLGLTDLNHTTTAAIEIFPNPTTGILFITGVENFDHHFIEIYHTSGQLLSREQLRSQQIDLKELPQGLYHIKISKDKTILFEGKMNRVK